MQQCNLVCLLWWAVSSCCTKYSFIVPVKFEFCLAKHHFCRNSGDDESWKFTLLRFLWAKWITLILTACAKVKSHQGLAIYWSKNQVTLLFKLFLVFSRQTTIMAVTFDGGVVLGADSRTSTGSYVANRVSDKIVPIHDFVWACRSGSAADTQAVSDHVRYYIDAHRWYYQQPTFECYNIYCNHPPPALNWEDCQKWKHVQI